MGAIGVRSVKACVYSSSSDDDGEEDRGESDGESNGFTLLLKFKFLSSAIEITPAGRSITGLLKK